MSGPFGRLFNGRPASPDWSGTRTLHYGDGVFRTALVWQGQIIDRQRQFARLASDAEALHLHWPAPAVAALATEAGSLAVAAGRGALRMTLSRIDGGRGYHAGSDDCDRLLELRPLPDHPTRCWTEGVVLYWSPVLLGIQRQLAGIKHCNRLEQVLASRGWQPDQDEALMCDAEGRVICGTRSNIFVVIDGVLVTPALDRSGVAGQMREHIIDLACTRGPGCEIGTLAPDEIRHASEAFVCNSLIGIWPVRRIGGLELPAPGVLTQQLSALLDHPWAGS